MIEKGSLVTAYRKGYHRVLEIEKDGNNTIVKTVQVMTVTFKPSAAVKDACAMDWCKLVDKDKLIKELEASIELIKTL